MPEIVVHVPEGEGEEGTSFDPSFDAWSKGLPPGYKVMGRLPPGFLGPEVSVSSDDDIIAGVPEHSSGSPIEDARAMDKVKSTYYQSKSWAVEHKSWVVEHKGTLIVAGLAFALMLFLVCGGNGAGPEDTSTTTTAAAPAQGQGNTITLTMTEDCPIIGSWSGYFTEADGDRSEDTFASELPWCQRETELTLTQNDNDVYVVGANKAAKVVVNPIREGPELTNEQLIHYNREGARETGCFQRGWEEFKPQLEAHLADKILKQTGQDVRVRLSGAPSGVEPTGTIEQPPPDSTALDWAAVEVECTTGSE